MEAPPEAHRQTKVKGGVEEFFLDIFPGPFYRDHDESQANNLFRNIMHELVVAHLYQGAAPTHRKLT